MTAAIKAWPKPDEFASTISAGFARALLDLAVAKGAPRAALLARAGIAEEALADQDSRLPLACYVALIRAGKELTGDPALALHYGEAFEVTELSIVGLMGQACETAADAFAKLGRFTRLMIDVPLEEEAAGERIVLSRIDGQLWLRDMRKDPNEIPEITESAFARMICSARRFAPGGWIEVKAVHFTHKEPAYRSEYDRIFALPLVFESDRNALLLADDGWMAIRSNAPSAYVYRMLSERAEALLDDLEGAGTVRGRVETLVTAALHEGGADMVAVARRMGISRPTLFRRLKAEGTNFEALVEALRRRLALHYLGEVSVGEAAYLLGFSDRSAFSRAFKRWTGRGPGAARRDGRPSRPRAPYPIQRGRE
jgi:AraC-like DNA-binding protein